MRNLILKGIILRQPTIDELKKGSDYLEFHVRMYLETYNELISEEEVKGWNTKHNCFLESHLLHTRILIEFFISTPESKKWPTDLIAADYISDWNEKYLDKIDIDKNFFKEIKDVIGGYQLHLTSKFVPYLISQNEWKISKIYEILHPIILKFLDCIPQEKVDPISHNEAKQILDNIIFWDDDFSDTFST
jgi:hypothetical protein